ncbi:hypothetical protein AZF37_03770 [endosymbiont 'TC1' of Trimyema compressum]|uniref:bifunctional riboflavin kinase/FAD synthetase n=1 Tax=endosymbiont 'TC1' of Trimyema compressum TaxID=243899 RepID=UPI0007F17F66|nr:bifunctional riboflavin kinase/FAD synthetase [endosymbiont 'TC1' of Trimyema compressum]AMP20404.1 hypothetical protein AZF37_03770 [endosymbiont 'TC1' of Trimyema compressum]
MEFFKRIEDVFFHKDIIAVLGNFDGCHKGHRELVKAALKRKEETGASILVITFDPHSKDLKGESIKRIQTLDEKLQCFEKLGVDGVSALAFTETFSKMNREDFLKNILIDKIGVTDIVVGHDYRFGYQGAGNVDFLEEKKTQLGYHLIVVPAFKIQGEVVSSSKIRTLIEAGEIVLSKDLLGYYPLVTGQVIHGSGVGKTLGFATANLLIDEVKIIPKVGVYGVIGHVSGKKVRGFCNVGYQPTFDRKKQLVVEVHFFDFNEDVYGEIICIHFIKRMRDEIKFNSVEELKAQLRKDQISIENELN